MKKKLIRSAFISLFLLNICVICGLNSRFDANALQDGTDCPDDTYYHVDERLKHRICFPLIWENYLKCVDEPGFCCNPGDMTTCGGGGLPSL